MKSDLLQATCDLCGAVETGQWGAIEGPYICRNWWTLWIGCQNYVNPGTRQAIYQPPEIQVCDRCLRGLGIDPKYDGDAAIRAIVACLAREAGKKETADGRR